MPHDSPRQFAGIFISYRRDDSIGHAGRLYDRLSAQFGEDQLFMDLDHIEPGDDFVQVINDAVGSCEILIALIGKNWLASADRHGRRLDNPSDFVRLEIKTALERNIRVIPVLVHGAHMPAPQDLPADLAHLARRQAHELSDKRWRHDVEQLIGALENVLDERRRAREREAQAAAARPRNTGELQRAQAEEGARRSAAERLRRQRERFKQERARARRSTGERAPAEAETAAARPVGADGHAQEMTNRVGVEFVWIPPGSFVMGSDQGPPDERPAHRVTFGAGFYLARHEITQAQWQAVMGDNPSHFRGRLLPVETISWTDAQEFVARLSAADEEYEYRLPTEAEWEYACRAGTTGDYAGELDEVAWYYANAGDAQLSGEWRDNRVKANNNRPHPVGSKLPNAFGLFDMHGNLWEWCEDYYHPNYNNAPADGAAWLGGGDTNLRVLRGGSWDVDADFCRSANRNWGAPNDRSNTFGLRLAAVARTSPTTLT